MYAGATMENKKVDPSAGPLYGMVLFKNKKDTTVKRGAVQKSLLLFCFRPMFSVFEPLMRVTLNRIFEKGEKPLLVLKTLYTALSDESLKKEMQINLFGEKFLLKLPRLQDDKLEFAGCSLLELVTRFQIDTMILWHALLTGKRILFVGSPARSVANCCFMCPLLVSPLRGFSRNIHPYVSLTDLTPVTQKGSFICGTTNMLFESKPELWWDFCGSFASGAILHNSKAKITGSDRIHIYNVLGGIKDGRNDLWVREQFHNYTQRFLDAVTLDNVNADSSHKRTMEIFKGTAAYQQYIKQLKENKLPKKGNTVQEILEDLKRGEQLQILERVKKIFELSKMTTDLSTIDEVINLNGVAIVAEFLLDENSQYRKYSAACLAQLASSVKGQLAILEYQDILPAIYTLLKDEMPNVRIGASYCIMKLSQLYIGTRALLETGVLEHLVLDQKVTDILWYSLQTLLNIYRYVPTTKRIPLQKDDLLSSDSRCYEAVLLLLDHWMLNTTDQITSTTENTQQQQLAHVSVVLDIGSIIKISQKTRNMFGKIDSVDKQSRQEALKQTLDRLSPSLLFELIDCGVVKTLMEKDSISKGKFISLEGIQLLIHITDTNYGRAKILQDKEIFLKATKMLKNCKADLYHLTLLSWMVLLVQHDDSALKLVESGAIELFIRIILKHYYNILTSSLCVRAMECLQGLLKKCIDTFKIIVPSTVVNTTNSYGYLENASDGAIGVVLDMDTLESIKSSLGLLEILEKLPLGKSFISKATKDSAWNLTPLLDGFEEFEGEKLKNFSASLDVSGVKTILNEMLEKILVMVGRKLQYEVRTVPIM